ncbi:MAG: IS6 family transposase [Alphaproteobacteria bacterium]|nr:MAG: IS6 family transposase [Alphaproteobacteria bacterium]
MVTGFAAPRCPSGHPNIIKQAVWLYFLFTMSYRDAEELLAERGIEVSYETVRRWALKFGIDYARRIQKRRPLPHTEWFLDEVFVKIGGKPMYLWRAVDGEGEVLDVLVQKRRNKRAALKLLRKLLQNQGISPTKIVTDKLRSYSAALRDLNIKHLHDTTNRLNNRAESSHVPIRRRERKMQRFKSHKSAQIFLSIYGSIYNLFNTQRHLISRKTLRQLRSIAMIEWSLVTNAA